MSDILVTYHKYTSPCHYVKCIESHKFVVRVLFGNVAIILIFLGFLKTIFNSNMSYIRLYQDFIGKDGHALNHGKNVEITTNDVVDITAEDPEIDKDYEIQMEHSYSRDCRVICGANGLFTKTLMIHKPPHCPSCQLQPNEENNDVDEGNHTPIPSYDEALANDSMNECLKTAQSINNNNPDDEDWEERINKNGWTSPQNELFSKIVHVFDLDRLARLAMAGKQHETVQNRIIIDKSVQRVRNVLSSVSWDPRLTQWLHGLLMDNLPTSYMAIYLNILQTLKSKLPTLVDKMLFGRPPNVNQDLLVPALKKPWEPIISPKVRKLPQDAVIVVIPNNLSAETVSKRTENWCRLMSTFAQVVQITIPLGTNAIIKQTIEQLAEQIVSLARLKIQDLRNEQPSRPIVLVGFNAGASLALQVALSENVNSIVCMGFAYNTINGTRGDPDDHILFIKAPILFVIGQNSARSSHEEMESLREKMHSETSLVVIGSADDFLRVPKSKRKIENVTQSMVDDMVMDELFEFINKCITNPPGPRQPTISTGVATNAIKKTPIGTASISRKRKSSCEESELQTKVKHHKITSGSLIGRPRTRPLHVSMSSNKPITKPLAITEQASNEDLNMAIESILGDDSPTKIIKDGITSDGKIVTTYEIVSEPKTPFSKSSLKIQSTTPLAKRHGGTSNQQSTTKIKMLPSNQFVQLKPPIQSQSKIYTIKTTPTLGGSQQTVTSSSDGTPFRRQASQVYTLKTVSNSISQQTISSGQLNIVPSSKYTLKSGPTVPTIINLPIAENRKIVISTKNDEAPPTDISNIFDMPIIFADNDGNIQDNMNSSSTAVIDSQPKKTVGKNTFVITNAKQHTVQAQSTSGSSGSSEEKPKQNRMVFINRNSIRPYSNIVPKSTVPPLHRYSKVVVTNPKPKIIPSLQESNNTKQTVDASKISNSVKRINLQKFKSVNSAPPSTSTSNILNFKSTIGGKQFKPIVISVDKIPTLNNSTKMVVNQKPKAQSIVLKSGTIKPIPIQYKPTIINRNLTVRKMVNIVPQVKTGIFSTTISKLKTSSAVSCKTVTLNSDIGRQNEDSLDGNSSTDITNDTLITENGSDVEIVTNITSALDDSDYELDAEIES